MTAIVITAVFIIATCFAVATILTTLRRYLPELAGLRAALATGAEQQDVRITVLTYLVEDNATVIRPEFARRKAGPVREFLAAA